MQNDSQRYNIILFDADETLFDFIRAEREAFFTTFNHFTNQLPTEEIFSDYHIINESLWRDFEKKAITKQMLILERFNRLFQKHSLSLDASIFNDFYFKRLGEGAYLLDSAEEVCREMHKSGRRLFIITNGVAATQHARFDRSPIKQYFDNIFISDSIGAGKPSPVYFDYVKDNIKDFDSRKALVIGDALTSDIAGANAAGIDSVWFNPLKKINSGQASPDFEIEHLKQLYEII